MLSLWYSWEMEVLSSQLQNCHKTASCSSIKCVFSSSSEGHCSPCRGFWRPIMDCGFTCISAVSTRACMERAACVSHILWQTHDPYLYGFIILCERLRLLKGTTLCEESHLKLHYGHDSAQIAGEKSPKSPQGSHMSVLMSIPISLRTSFIKPAW